MSPQEPLLKESLSAIKTLYNLALFRSHEPEFLDLLHTLLNIQSVLKDEQRNALKSSKITDYFQNTESQKIEVADSETNDGEVILVD